MKRGVLGGAALVIPSTVVTRPARGAASVAGSLTPYVDPMPLLGTMPSTEPVAESSPSPQR